jgi:hypothetical protein
MRKRDPSLSEGWGQIVTSLEIETAGLFIKILFFSDDKTKKMNIFEKIYQKNSDF